MGIIPRPFSIPGANREKVRWPVPMIAIRILTPFWAARIAARGAATKILLEVRKPVILLDNSTSYTTEIIPGDHRAR
ncbi:MAG: hypothetical protein M1436_01730, partial [Acidobacteria bacterium]|nr:hypothetical protein [Acidobacteriota bacterium]